MHKPVILSVDDDIQVLHAIERDLRHKYGQEYRIVSAESGASALEATRHLNLRGEPVALFLVDQRMPGMTGIEFLAQVIQSNPDAKRVLLTAYSDTNAAIQSINEIRLDYYILKPWDPPEENVYPILDDLLADWHADYRPPFEGIRLLGYRWSPQFHEMKEFLARNLLPFRTLDVELDAESGRLLKSMGLSDKPDPTQLPIVAFPDGSHLMRPSENQLAEHAGLQFRPGLAFYDLVVVGAGPAGLSASVYASSEGLRTLLVEGEAPGGQAGSSARIENYLGFPSGLSGADLTRRAITQAKRFGVELLTPQTAAAVRVEDPYRFIKLGDGTELSCHALIVATGVSYRKLEVPGVDSLTGTGIYYGSANTEAAACRGQDVFVVGGGNSAGQAAVYLSRFAKTVTILIRAASLTESMSQYLIDQIESVKNIHLLPKTVIAEARGEKSLESLTLTDVETKEQQTVPAFAAFVYIGAAPRTDWLGSPVLCDEQGFVLTGADVAHSPEYAKVWKQSREPFFLESSVPGLFAAGDVRHGSAKRIAFGVGDGAMAVQFVHRYLAGL